MFNYVYTMLFLSHLSKTLSSIAIEVSPNVQHFACNINAGYACKICFFFFYYERRHFPFTTSAVLSRYHVICLIPKPLCFTSYHVSSHLSMSFFALFVCVCEEEDSPGDIHSWKTVWLLVFVPIKNKHVIFSSHALVCKLDDKYTKHNLLRNPLIHNFAWNFDF